jgi:receptor protein-tyrosine kinase
VPSGDSATGRTFDVLVAGAAIPPNPGELVESHAMEALLEQAKSAYDLVVVDTPPLTAVSDAFPLLGKVDGVVIVGRVGRNRRDVAERLHETLSGAGAPLLGVIANGFKARRNAPYSYAYDYSYASEKRSATPAAGVSPNGGVSAEEPVSTTKG